MSRTRSMSPGRPLRSQKSPYNTHSQQLQQQHLAQLQQLQQLNQRFGSSNSSFSSSSSHTPTQPSSANSTHSSSRHSVYGTHNYASSDRSVSQPALSEPGTPTLVPDRYRRKSMVNLPSHERSPSLPTNSSGAAAGQGSHVTSPQTYVQQAHTNTANHANTNNSPPPRLSYSSTDSSANSTTAASTSTIGTVHSFHQKSKSREEDHKQMVLPSDARRKSLLQKDPMGTLQDQRASAISLSSYHTVQSSPARSMTSSRESSPESEHELRQQRVRDTPQDELRQSHSHDNIHRDSTIKQVKRQPESPTKQQHQHSPTPQPQHQQPVQQKPQQPEYRQPVQPVQHQQQSSTTSYEDAVAAGVAAMAGPAESGHEPVSSNYDVAAAQYDAPVEQPKHEAPTERYTAPVAAATPAAAVPSDASRYRAKPQEYSQPSHQQSQRTMSLGGSSTFKDFDQPLTQTKSNMSIGGKSIGGMSTSGMSTSGMSTSGMSTSGMSTQSSFSGLRHQKSSGSLREKFKKVFSFGRKSSLSSAPTGSQSINLTPGYVPRSERTSTMTSTTSGRSFSEFLRRSSKPDNFDDARSIESNKSSSSFAALKRAGKNLLKKNPEQARTKSSSQSAYEVPVRGSSAPSAVPSRAGTPTPKLVPQGQGLQAGMSPPKNTATASLSVSPAEVDREKAEWSAGSSLEGVLGGGAAPAPTPVASAAPVAAAPASTPTPMAAAAAAAAAASTVPNGYASDATAAPSSAAASSPSPTSSPSSINGGSAGSETDADEFVAAETVFPKHLGVEDIDNIRTSLDRTKSLERRGSRRRKVTPDSHPHHTPEEAVPNPTEVHVHHPKSSLGRSDSTTTPRSILKTKQSDGSMVSVDTVTVGDMSRESREESRDVSHDTILKAPLEEQRAEETLAHDAIPGAAESRAVPHDFLGSGDILGETREVAETPATATGESSEVESMFANFSSISSDLDLSFSTQLEPLGLPVRPESPTPSQQSSVRSTDSASVSRFATKLKDNLFKRKETASGFNPDLAAEPISETEVHSVHSPYDQPETASIISTEAPSLTESFRSEGSYSAPVPPQIPGGAAVQRGNAPLRHFSPGPTPSATNSHNRRFSGHAKTPQTAASRRYHQHWRSASYGEDGSPETGSPTSNNYPVSSPLNAPSPAPRKGNVSFSSRIVIYDTWDADDYDRRTEPATCNRLTPLLAQQIKEELNNFKMNMDVHHESRIYTHFF